MKPHVYYAHPLDLSRRQSAARDLVEVAEAFREKEATIVNKDFLTQEISSREVHRAKGASAIAHLVEKELELLKKANLLFVDLRHPTPQLIGCVSEMTYAHIWGKPVVVVTSDQSIVKRPWFRYHADAIEDKLGKAVDRAAELLGSSPDAP